MHICPSVCVHVCPRVCACACATLCICACVLPSVGVCICPPKCGYACVHCVCMCTLCVCMCAPSVCVYIHVRPCVCMWSLRVCVHCPPCVCVTQNNPIQKHKLPTSKQPGNPSTRLASTLWLTHFPLKLPCMRKASEFLNTGLREAVSDSSSMGCVFKLRRAGKTPLPEYVGTQRTREWCVDVFVRQLSSKLFFPFLLLF